MLMTRETIASRAAAIADADVVLRLPSSDAPPRCMLCAQERTLAVALVVNHTGAGVGQSPPPVVGVCAPCRDAASDARRAAVAELALTAARADAMLSLIRRRADRELADWWATVGTCTADDVDQVCVEVRRAVERLGGER